MVRMYCKGDDMKTTKMNKIITGLKDWKDRQREEFASEVKYIDSLVSYYQMVMLVIAA